MDDDDGKVHGAMGRVVDVDGEVRREVDGEAGVDTGGGGVWGLQPPLLSKILFFARSFRGFWRLQPPLLSKLFFRTQSYANSTPPPLPCSLNRPKADSTPPPPPVRLIIH